MKKGQDKPAGAAELRRRAEERLREKQSSQRSEVGDQSTAEKTQRLVHELEVHQIELEMQNEGLKQSQAEVEAILGQYTDLYDFAPVGYFTLDRDGAIRQVNLTGARLLGVERSGLVNRRFGLFVSDDSRPAFNAFLKRVFESQANETCELALRKEANDPLWADIEAAATQDGQACRAVVVDITGRKRAEETQRLVHELQVHQIELETQNEELQRARAEVEAILGQYTDLYDFAPVGYFTLDRDGAIRGVNLTGARLLGVERSGLVNRRFGLFVSADSRPPFNAFLKKVFESQAKETCELALRNEANDPLWAHIEAAATQDGQACRAAVVDITERKRAEAEVQAAQEKLSAEQRRGQRRLKKVIRELEHRNRDLQDFVHAASHDLRAPLVNIRGFGDLLGSACQRARTAVASTQDGESLRAGLRPLLDEEIPDSLGYIRTSSSKMDALLTGLLNVSRIGSAALTIEQLDLNQMVAEILKSTEFSVEQAGATVQVDALPPCRGDANQLGQVFSNLLDNALKYLDPARPGVIRVSGCRKQNEVVYCVEDNGIGIDSAYQDAIFGLFHRLNPDRGTGLGLGLAIARRSLDRQDGKIWLESTPNQGSKFFFSLPSAQLSKSDLSKLHRQSETEVRR